MPNAEYGSSAIAPTSIDNGNGDTIIKYQHEKNWLLINQEKLNLVIFLPAPRSSCAPIPSLFMPDTNSTYQVTFEFHRPDCSRRYPTYDEMAPKRKFIIALDRTTANWQTGRWTTVSAVPGAGNWNMAAAACVCSLPITHGACWLLSLFARSPRQHQSENP